jgi:hypothetical protein
MKLECIGSMIVIHSLLCNGFRDLLHHGSIFVERGCVPDDHAPLRDHILSDIEWYSTTVHLIYTPFPECFAVQTAPP